MLNKRGSLVQLNHEKPVCSAAAVDEWKKMSNTETPHDE